MEAENVKGMEAEAVKKIIGSGSGSDKNLPLPLL